MSGFARGETYTVPHRMPDQVPLVSLRAGVIGDIRHAEEDVPLIHGEWLTDAGIHYLDWILDDPENERTNQPQDLYRKSWRAGLVPMPTPHVQDLTSASFEDYDRVMASMNTTRKRASELLAERDALTADLDRQIAQALADERALEEKLREPGPNSKVLIEARFPGDRDRVYEYIAMRTPGTDWYVTGRAGKMSWDSILHLVRNAASVEIFDLDFER